MSSQQQHIQLHWFPNTFTISHWFCKWFSCRLLPFPVYPSLSVLSSPSPRASKVLCSWAWRKTLNMHLMINEKSVPWVKIKVLWWTDCYEERHLYMYVTSIAILTSHPDEQSILRWYFTYFVNRGSRSHQWMGRTGCSSHMKTVEFEKWPVEVQDFSKVTNRFRGIYRIYSDLIKKTAKKNQHITGWTWKHKDIDWLHP